MPSTACWTWDVRSPSASPEPQPGLGQPRPHPRSMQQRRLHARDGAQGKRTGNQAAHAAVQRRVVEHHRRGVVLVQRAVPVFRQEFDRLVRGIGLYIAVDRRQIDVPGQEVLAVGHLLAWCERLQRSVCRVGIVYKFRSEARQVEVVRQCAGWDRAEALAAGRGTPTHAPAHARQRGPAIGGRRGGAAFRAGGRAGELRRHHQGRATREPGRDGRGEFRSHLDHERARTFRHGPGLRSGAAAMR